MAEVAFELLCFCDDQERMWWPPESLLILKFEYSLYWQKRKLGEIHVIMWFRCGRTSLRGTLEGRSE